MTILSEIAPKLKAMQFRVREAPIAVIAGDIVVQMYFTPGILVQTGSAPAVQFESRLEADIYMAEQIAECRGWSAFWRGVSPDENGDNEAWMRGWQSACEHGAWLMEEERLDEEFHRSGDW